MKIENLPLFGGSLTGHVVAWYTTTNNRFREAELKPRRIRVDWLGGIYTEVKREAIKAFKRQRKNCEALRLTVMFRMHDGIESKVSYLVEREPLCNASKTS